MTLHKLVHAPLTLTTGATLRSLRVMLSAKLTERPMPWEKRVRRRYELAGEFSVVALKNSY
jgi:hypothetical protein